MSAHQQIGPVINIAQKTTDSVWGPSTSQRIGVNLINKAWWPVSQCQYRCWQTAHHGSGETETETETAYYSVGLWRSDSSHQAGRTANFIVTFLLTDQIVDNILLKIMWIAKMSLKSDFISKEDPTKLAALQGDTNLLLELLEDGAPFIVDSVRSQSDRILYWICLIGLDLFLSLSFSKINCL